MTDPARQYVASGFPPDLAREIYAAWSPPPDLTVSQWADRFRKLSPEGSAEPGQWRTSRAEYARGIMDAVTDDRTHKIVAMWGSQTGKTEVLLNIIGYHIDHDPCPMLVTQPNVKPMAEAFSKDRISKMLRDTPALRGKVAEAKSRDSENTILHKTFPGGHLTIGGANSAASLASRPVRLFLADEVDRYPASANTEGDPVELGEIRTTTFWNRLIVETSTPTVRGASRIERSYENSDKRRFFVPCPHCDQYQTLAWEHVSWPKGQPERAQYGCAHCGVLWAEVERHRAVSRGEWRGTVTHECGECGQYYEADPGPACTECQRDQCIQPFTYKGVAGFHINAIYSPWVSLAWLAQKWTDAQGDTETLKVFINTRLAETWEEKGSSLDESDLARYVEAYTVDSLPLDILLVTAAVDVQGDRLEARSQGWGEKLERWNIEKRIFWGDPAQSAVWDELDEWLQAPYQVGPYSLPIACTAIDSGGHHTAEVYAFCKARQGRRVFAVKGSNEYYGPVVSKPSQHGNDRVMLYRVGTDTIKDQLLLGSLRLDSPGPGYIHFPSDTDVIDLEQLRAEERRIEYKRGHPRRVWVKRRERNEEIDLHVYNRAAYDILRPDTGAIKRKRAPVEAPDTAEPVQRRTTQRRQAVRVRKNWATDF